LPLGKENKKGTGQSGSFLLSPDSTVISLLIDVYIAIFQQLIRSDQVKANL